MYKKAKHSASKKNIVLIGFMGVGKTTVGQMIATKLKREFIDIDQYIEQTYHMSIPQIFEQKGEPYFRKLERKTVIDICQHHYNNIVSLGGGAFQQKEIREFCLENCLVLYLDISWESWKARFELINENRPVLNNRSLYDIQQLFNERKHAYSMHHLKINTDNKSPEEVTASIIEALQDN